ncbi:Tyrosine-protein kinase [Aphelenchoides besseyi]|nr:Tyrosine-protein kinase [Aphelenchoides besseyi]KAI6200768.1 Tyrosine-protein kinase [Aphelenchoides besseyi]
MIRKLIKGVEGKVSEPKEHTPVTTPDDTATPITNPRATVKTPHASIPPPARAKHLSIQLRPQDEPTREEETAPADDRIIHAPPKGQQHLIDNEAIALASEPYHGLMPRGEMSTLLTREGDFLVRKTEVGKTQRFVVSTFWNNRILHILIRLGANGRWSFSNMEVETISKLISFYMVTTFLCSNHLFSARKSGTFTGRAKIAVPGGASEMF